MSSNQDQIMSGYYGDFMLTHNLPQVGKRAHSLETKVSLFQCEANNYFDPSGNYM